MLKLTAATTASPGVVRARLPRLFMLTTSNAEITSSPISARTEAGRLASTVLSFDDTVAKPPCATASVTVTRAKWTKPSSVRRSRKVRFFVLTSCKTCRSRVAIASASCAILEMGVPDGMLMVVVILVIIERVVLASRKGAVLVSVELVVGAIEKFVLVVVRGIVEVLPSEIKDVVLVVIEVITVACAKVLVPVIVAVVLRATK
mmetsp:Transcript_80771/g.179480  ORF Transcript_80771/g.179480 Transcript_80771/m.179480 type:complete len:204 (+) Transcript_80771:140-751(+)